MRIPGGCRGHEGSSGKSDRYCRIFPGHQRRRTGTHTRAPHCVLVCVDGSSLVSALPVCQPAASETNRVERIMKLDPAIKESGISGKLLMPSPELNRSKERLAGIFLLALTLLSCFGAPHLVWFLRNGYQDFTVFYHGAEMVRAGHVAELHDLHPPFEELLFVPLTYLSN